MAGRERATLQNFLTNLGSSRACFSWVASDIEDHKLYFREGLVAALIVGER